MVFYTSSQYEIKPVTKGYCLCLEYDLVHSGCGPKPTLLDNQSAASLLVSAMRKWNEDEDLRRPLMAYMLEDDYKNFSLPPFRNPDKEIFSINSLKNSDKAVAAALFNAKKELDFDLFLGEVSVSEKWSAYSHRYSSGYDEEDIIEEEATVEPLLCTNGTSLNCNLKFDRGYIVPEYFFDGQSPKYEDAEEGSHSPFSCSDYVTVHKIFEGKALLIWPPKNRIQHLGIKKIVHVLKNKLKKNAKRAEVEILAQDLVQECALPVHSKSMCVETFVSLFHSLRSLGKVELVSKFLENIASSTCQTSLIVNSSFSSEIVASGKKFGWNLLRSPLQSMVEKIPASDVGKFCQFLYCISQQPCTDVQKDVCRSLAQVVVRVLSRTEDKKPTPTHSSFPPLPSHHQDKEFFIGLFRCLVTLECDEQLTTLTQVLVSKPYRYPVVDMIAPLCEGLYKALIEGEGVGKPLQQLISYGISSLEKYTKESKQASFTCSCNDCLDMMKFLNDPAQLEGRFKMAQHRRIHLSNQLAQAKIAVSTKTEMVSCPYTLIVTKKAQGVKKNDISEKGKTVLARFQSMKSIVSRYQAVATNTSSVSEEPLAKRIKIEP